MKISENALDLLQKRYFLPGEKTWEDLCRRVAANIASAEPQTYLQHEAEQNYFRIMYNLDFLPSTPCLLNAGTPTQQLSSCFILDIEDSIESIMTTLAECAKIFQKSGGCGFNISALRPKGSILNNSGGQASGPVSFMRLFNQLVEEVKHGNARKGAIKIDLDVSHPDIYEFIHCKDDTTQLQNMNISVSITDEFMNAVKQDANWSLHYGGKVHQVVKAKDLWNEIIAGAWATGEPGLSFRDTMNRYNMNPQLGEIKGSNPCAEYINISYSSCNLGSINLANCVIEKNGKYEVDYTRLERLAEMGIEFIDNMITVNKLPLTKIQEVTEMMRPVGLGTMGLAEMMFKLRIPMNSPQGIEFIDGLYKQIRQYAEEASQGLALRKGTYPAWKGSVWQQQDKEMRNSNILSVAPNGSIGFIAGVNGGIEPVFALVHTRRTQEGHEYFVVNEVLKETLAKESLLSDDILRKISNNRGSVKGIKEIPQWIQDVFVTAMDMTPMEHLECLDAVCKYVDLSVSKTINLPNEATKEDVANIYFRAWEMGNIKGTTVYRDGSRQYQVLTTGTKKEEPVPTLPVGLRRGEVKEAPAVSDESRTVRLNTGCGTMYLTTTKDADGNIDQTFVSRGSKGTCLSNQTAVSRLISLALRTGVPVEQVVDQLRSVPVCPAYYGQKCRGQSVSPGSSCPSAIAYELEKHMKLKGKKVVAVEEKTVSQDKTKCPTCGESVYMEEGCVSCKSCGWSKCN